MLEGQDIDQTSLARSAEIMDQVKKVTAEREKKSAEAAGVDATTSS
jgi:hypothetical protein